MTLNFSTSRFALRTAAISACLVLTSCGGGGSSSAPTSSGPPPPPVLTAPTITSAGSVSIVENTTGSIYTAVATDPQGDAITWEIFSGPDAGSFTIDSAGNLSIQSSPNFDLPQDANQDNIYEVTILARAGGETDTLVLSVSVENDFEGIKTVRIAEGFTDPVGLASRFDGLKFLVAQRDGQIFEIDGQTGSVENKTDEFGLRRNGEYLAIYEYLGQGGSEGAIMVVMHSAAEGLMLHSYHPIDDVYGFPRQLAVPSNEDFKVAMWGSGRPVGGGSVLIAVGDPTGTVAQNATVGYGKLFETLPVDPFGGAGGGRRYGFRASMIGDGIRAPSGGSLWLNGRTMLIDQGASAEHELTIFRYDWRPLDFGWPFYEGATAVRANPPAALNGPNLIYKFGAGPKEGQGIIGGVGYSGNIPGIQGHYVFGDISGKIWSIPSSQLDNEFREDQRSIEARTEDFVPDAGTIDSPIAFGLSSQVLFILDADGEVFRVDQR